MNLGRTWRYQGRRINVNLRIEFTNVFNRSFWGDPSGTALTNAKLQQVYVHLAARPTGNTNTGFGKVSTTAPSAFGSVFNLQPRQGVVVGRFEF